MKRFAIPASLIARTVPLPAAAFDPIDTERRTLLDHVGQNRAGTDYLSGHRRADSP